MAGWNATAHARRLESIRTIIRERRLDDDGATFDLPGEHVVHVDGAAYSTLLDSDVTVVIPGDELREAGWITEDDAWRDRGAKTVARRSFLRGFGQGAADRIRESRKQVIVEADAAVAGTALVMVDRAKAAKAAFAQLTSVGFTTVRSSSRTNHNAAEGGRAAGANASTGGASIGGGRQAIGR